MNVNDTKRAIFFFIVACGFLWIVLHRSISFSAEQGKNEFHLLELISSAKDLPNPHSPFWITSEKLGFVSEQEINRKSLGGLFVYDLSTKKMQKLLDRPVLYPDMLRKENKIAFVDVGKQKTISLFTMSIDGKDIKELDFQGSAVFDPSWSPDNRKVVFAGLSYDADLFIGNVQTSRIEGLGDLGRGIETNGTEAPDWSPNGTDIVYIGWDKNSREGKDNGVYHPTFSRIYSFDLRTKQYKRLTDGQFKDIYPSYSSDGRYLAFISDRSKNVELWVMDLDGTNLRQLTNMAGLGHRAIWEKPKWSPDQRRIAFSAKPLTHQLGKDTPEFEGSSIWLIELK